MPDNNTSGGGGRQTGGMPAARNHETESLDARDPLQLMLIRYGDVHIETLGQLLRITRSVENEYSRMRARRWHG